MPSIFDRLELNQSVNAAEESFNSPDDAAYQNLEYKTEELPIFHKGVASHNFASGSPDVLEPRSFSDNLDDVGRFIKAATYSAAYSFENSFIGVGNLFSSDEDDAEYTDTSTALYEMDSDLGKYYDENKSAIDISGFIVSSFIPGLVGIKAANLGTTALRSAAQSGKLGKNLGVAFGIETPAVYSARAAAEFAKAEATYSVLNANAVKAIASGIGGQALDGVFFELATMATMYKSPVFSESDAGDLVKHVALGGAIGGVFGGLLEGARAYGAIKRGVITSSREEKVRTFTNASVGSFTASDRLLLASENLEATVPLTIDASGKAVRQTDTRINNLLGEMRLEVNNLAKGNDPELGNQVADLIQGVSHNKLLGTFSHVTGISRVGVRNADDRLADTLKAKAVPGASPATTTSYLRLIGEDAGSEAFDEAPKILRLADTSKNSEQILEKIADYGFSTKKLWNAIDETDHLAAEARYFWASKRAKIVDGMKVGFHDLALSTRIAKDWLAQTARLQTLERGAPDDVLINSIKAVDKDGSETVFTNADDFMRHLRASKYEVSRELLKRKKGADGLHTDAIAIITDTRASFIRGTLNKVEDDDLFGTDFYTRQFNEALKKKGIKESPTPLIFKPSVVKINRDISDVNPLISYELQGAGFLQAKALEYKAGMQRVAANAIPEKLLIRLPDVTADDVIKSTRLGAGPGLASAASGAYNSVEAKIQQIGSVTADLETHLKDTLLGGTTPIAVALAGKLEAAIEFSVINQKILSTAEHYVPHPDGSARLIARKQAAYIAKVQKGEKNVELPDIQKGAPVEIPVNNAETWAALNTRIRNVGWRTERGQERLAVQGLENQKDPRTFYPIRPDYRDYKHFFFVTDETIASGASGHMTMVHAASAEALEKLRELVPSYLKTRTKSETEKYFKSRGEFDWERTLHENYIDTELKRAGVASEYFPQTDPQKIVDTWIADELRSTRGFAKDTVASLYEKEFNEFRQLGLLYDNLESSKYGMTNLDWAESTTKNPYKSYIKTALNINQASENKFIYGLNNLADGFVSKTIQPIADAWRNATRPADLEAVNNALQKAGYNSAYYGAAEQALANHTAPKGVLAKFVRDANSILANITLGLDPLNAINNAVGGSVLLGTEVRNLIGNIAEKNTELAGNLGRINLPGNNGDSILSPSKLIAEGIRRNFDRSPEGLARNAYLEKIGIDRTIQKQMDSILDDLTLTGNESVSQLERIKNAAFAKAKAFTEKGVVLTGNAAVEKFNRMTAANVMLQILEAGEKVGVVSRREFPTYINTFINRTQGNFLASQRPLIFQGPIGQAVGLFQTYQFNLLQQLFRYVGEGKGKDAAFLLGLQGTVYGLNGLPAFNYLNTHIVGSLSGNPEHRDIYSQTYGIAGKTAGDWLLYGAPSNLLKTNLFTRGDINPRHPTIIPVSPLDIPIVSVTGRIFDNVKDMSQKIGSGGDVWQTILQGIEHNGVSRPLAGIAQSAQAISNGGYGVSTDTRGRIIGANDFISWATAARIAGGKPIDEAIINDATYRSSVYQSVDRERMRKLREAIRSQVVGGELPEAEEVGEFAAKYVELGGTQKQFAKYMLKQITETNTPQANKLVEDLKSNYSQNMQKIMKDREVFAPGFLQNNPAIDPAFGGDDEEDIDVE